MADAAVNLRALDRAIRAARTVRAAVLRCTLLPTLTAAQAKAQRLVQLTYTYDPEDADDIAALHRAFHDLPAHQRHLVAHGKLIAIWRSK